MSTGIDALNEREKETLRLLLACHDAKSIARTQGLSVHTVNERLRDARRKLGVSSSREAARLLGESEQWRPKNLGDKEIGVAAEASVLPSGDAPGQGRRPHKAVPWLIGGTLVMSLLIAAALLSSVPATEGPTGSLSASTAATATSAQSAATRSAEEWLRLVDRQQWEQSWRSAGTLFKSQVTAPQWAATVEPVRKPLGAVSKRALLRTTKQSALPGVPAGEYEIVEFNTNFAARKDSVETVVLARESTGWKVVGYFVR